MMNNIKHKRVFLSTERLITLNIDILDWHLLNTTTHPSWESILQCHIYFNSQNKKTYLHLHYFFLRHRVACCLLTHAVYTGSVSRPRCWVEPSLVIISWLVGWRQQSAHCLETEDSGGSIQWQISQMKYLWANNKNTRRKREQYFSYYVPLIWSAFQYAGVPEGFCPCLATGEDIVCLSSLGRRGGVTRVAERSNKDGICPHSSPTVLHCRGHYLKCEWNGEIFWAWNQETFISKIRGSFSPRSPTPLEN